MYNFKLKSYGNGTAQMTYYHKPIQLKEDTNRNRQATYLEFLNDTEYLNYFYRRNNFEDDDRYLLDNIQDGILYMDNYASVPNILGTEYKLQSPFGDYIRISGIPDTEPEPVNITPEELAEKKERSIISSLNRSKKKIIDYGRSNVWDWFITLTFDRVQEFNAENLELCKKKVSQWFKDIRKKHCKNIKYLAIPEQHESGAWHFHCLVSNCDELDFEVAINHKLYLEDKKGNLILDKYGARIPNKYYGKELRISYPDGDFIYNIKQYKNGFTTATRITDTKKAVSYIIKYVTKEIVECGFGKRRYLPSNNLELPVETYALLDNKDLSLLITDIEYKFGLKLSIDQIKTYKVDVENYSNTVTIFEFDLPAPDAEDDTERKKIKLNEIMEAWYE